MDSEAKQSGKPGRRAKCRRRRCPAGLRLLTMSLTRSQVCHGPTRSHLETQLGIAITINSTRLCRSLSRASRALVRVSPIGRVLRVRQCMTRIPHDWPLFKLASLEGPAPGWCSDSGTTTAGSDVEAAATDATEPATDRSASPSPPPAARARSSGVAPRVSAAQRSGAGLAARSRRITAAD